jgi:hypothetical protein
VGDRRQKGADVTGSLYFYGILGVASTVFAFTANRRLFAPGLPAAGRVTFLEGTYYVVGVISLLLGWYFNIRCRSGPSPKGDDVACGPRGSSS